MKPALPSRQEQVDELRMIGESRAAPACSVLAIGGFAAAALVEEQSPRVLYLFLAGCASLVGLAAGFGLGHVRNAAAATRKGRRDPAPLVLRHGERDEDGDHPRGLHSPAARHAQACGIHFVNNRGWKPDVGAIQVEAVYPSGIA